MISIGELVLYVFGHNARVAEGVHYAGIFVGVVATFALQSLLVLANSILYCAAAAFEAAVTMLGGVMHVTDTNVVDLLVGGFVFGGLFYTLYTTLVRGFSLYRTVYMFLFSVTAKKLIFARTDVILALPEPKKLETNEAPLEKDFVYEIPETYPKGVFIVFGLKHHGDGNFLMNGHGFVAGGKMYITAHQAAADYDELFVANPKDMNRLMKIDVVDTLDDEEADVVEVGSRGICAALGLKSLKWRYYNVNDPVIVLHFDSVNKMYTQQSVYPIKYDEGESLYYQVLTKSFTTAGDSGFPLMQKGDVVAIHKGFEVDETKKPYANCAHIPFTVAKAAYTGSRTYSEVIPSKLAKYRPEVESPATGGITEDRFKRFQIAQEAKAEARKRGEHVDEQGFRVNSKKQRPELNTDGGDDDEERGRKERDDFLDEMRGMSEAEMRRFMIKNKVKGPWGNETPVGDVVTTPASTEPDLKESGPESRAPITAEKKVTFTAETNSKELNPLLLEEAEQFIKLLHSKASPSDLAKSLNKLKSLPSFKADSQKKQNPSKKKTQTPGASSNSSGTPQEGVPPSAIE